MSLVDVAMVGHLGSVYLAAAGMGGMILWGFLSLAIGIRTAVQTTTSRRLGQNRLEECGVSIRNGFLMATIYSVPLSIFGWQYSYKIIPYFINEGLAIEAAISYTSIIFLSLFFSAQSFVLTGFYNGIEKTKIHLSVTIMSNLINVYLNFGLIYGSDGVKEIFQNSFLNMFNIHYLWNIFYFPELGIKGAAIGTVISSIWMMGHYSFYLFKPSIRIPFNIFSISFDKILFFRQFQLAIPMGIQETFISTGFLVFYKIMATIGLLELAVTQLLFQIMHASFMPAIGVGQAVSTLVSKHMGEGKINKSISSIREGVLLSEYIMGSVGLLFILFPEIILNIFTKDVEIITYGIYGLRILGFVQFVDAVGLTLWFALSGAGNTFFPAILESILIWFLLLPGSYFLGVYLNWGFKGAMIPFPIYILIFSTVMVWKIKKGDWKQIVV